MLFGRYVFLFFFDFMGKKLNRGFKIKEQILRLVKILVSLVVWQNCIKEDKEREGGLSFVVVVNDYIYNRLINSECDIDVLIEEVI